MSATTLQRPLRIAVRVLIGAGIVFALLYVLVIAEPPPEFGGNWRTTNFGSAIDDWQSFTRTLLNGLTAAGLLFIVASGFSLIFGLMRVVNMAHGSFYLLGGYIAYEVQQKMTGQGFSLARQRGEHVGVDPAGPRRRRASIGGVGLVVQQVFLRWNQGQELRQALITIAISVIIADQVIAHFNDGHRRRASPGPAGPSASSSSRSSGSSTRSHGSSCSFLGLAVGCVALGLALPHAHGHGDPGGRRRPADDLGARREHPAHVRDRVHRRLGAGGASAASSARPRARSPPVRTGSGSSTRSSS